MATVKSDVFKLFKCFDCLRLLVGVTVLGACIALGPLAGTAAARPADAIADFSTEARTLYRVAACASAGAPARYAGAWSKHHCARLARAITRYERGWLARARPFFSRVVPKKVSATIVYPFAGGDLLTALAVFPNMHELTTISMEPAGDPRALDHLALRRVRAELVSLRHGIEYLLRVGFSATVNLDQIMVKSRLPGQLIFSLVALRVHGYEPVSLRYFRFRADGTVRYLRRSELPAFGRGSTHARNKRFGNMELGFRRRGGKGRTIVYRHVQANLANKYLAKPLMRHLRAKGHVAAMTKAASYLLWWRKFSRFRRYLLRHVDWMVSDASGLLPMHARPAGFRQRTYGRFEGVILNIARWLTKDAVRLWRSQPRRKLPFRFGYPDDKGHSNLLITYRKS